LPTAGFSLMGKRIAFVPPRFGAQVVGGSEAVSREACMGLAARGWDVEVLTTCAIDHFTWRNELAPGTFSEDGVVVRRFPTVHTPSRAARKAQVVVQEGGVPGIDEQVSWLSYSFQVPGLFAYLLDHGADYDVVVFSPYLFWTTAVCMPLVATRAVVIPCLHDEPYARLDVLRPVLSEPALVWFLSEPEHQLAHRLGPVSPRHSVTGAGVHAPHSYDVDGFRARHGLYRPFMLYAGRREAGKGWDWLLDAYAFATCRAGVDIDLVTIGVGDVDPPVEVKDRVIDLGYLAPAERDSAFAAASAYVQPSRMESFSRTIMEAWLANTPVLAFAESEVVAWHCERSGGGLTFSDRFEFAEGLRYVSEAPQSAARLAERGARYVRERYSWEVVLDRMEADLKGLV
jgi:glycosyltransferase involved in cell wall biosynthesis